MGGRILVGVDGSDGSRRALAWAVEEAGLRQAVVEAVIAWQSPYDRVEEVAFPGDEHEIAEAARAELDAAIVDIAGRAPAVEIDPVVVEGDPADVLCRRAHGADLLVLGARRHVGVAGALLGSVAGTCSHRSPCPVVMLPR